MPSNARPQYRNLAIVIYAAALLTTAHTAHASQSGQAVNRFRLVAQQHGYLGNVDSPSNFIKLPPGEILNTQLMGLHHGWHHLPPLNRISRIADRVLEELMVYLTQPLVYKKVREGALILNAKKESARAGESQGSMVIRAGDFFGEAETFEMPVTQQITGSATSKARVQAIDGRLLLDVDDVYHITETTIPRIPDRKLPKILRQNDSWRVEETYRESLLSLMIDEQSNLTLHGHIRRRRGAQLENVDATDEAIHLRAEELGWTRDKYVEKHDAQPDPHEVQEVLLAACGGDAELVQQVLAEEEQIHARRREYKNLSLQNLSVGELLDLLTEFDNR